MLINLRNALMTGKRLPYDAEVEYLEGTRTQWINTGVEGKSGLSANIVFMFSTGMVGKDKYVIGAVGTGAVRCYLGTYQSKWMFGYSSYYQANGIQDNVQYDVQVSWLKGNQYVKVSGTDIITATNNTDFNTGQMLYLFTRNNMGGSALVYAASAKIYSCKIWDNGTLLRDFIPVRKGAVGYLYDRVSGKLFGNAGTGDFVLGPDVVPVEYIESHGTEWIDTGVVPNDNIGSIVDTMAIGAVPNLRILGVYETISGVQQRFAAVVRSGGNGVDYRQFYFGWGSAYNFTASETNFMTRRVMGLNFLNSRSMTFDGVVVSSNLPTLATFTTSAWLFGNRGTTELAAQRIYRCQMSSGNEILRSFRAVRVGTDATSWEGAMMDVLTRRIYRNAGTGAFTYGNDLKYPIPSE